MPPSNWSDETIERFRKMCVETNVSYTIVGAAFGVSRNAAIGRARRMGIGDQRPNRRGPKGVKMPGPEPRTPSAPQVKRRMARFREPNLKVVHPEPDFDFSQPPPDCLMVDLLDLTSDNCHWPIGMETPQKFCGRSRSDSKHPSYCCFHHRLGTRRK
jgi:hypothetical protein